jgi:hypothetical protein
MVDFYYVVTSIATTKEVISSHNCVVNSFGIREFRPVQFGVSKGMNFRNKSARAS